MKTKILALIVAIAALGGCKKEIKLEVKQLHETDKTAQWTIDARHPVFSSTEDAVEKSCVIFNDEMTGLVNGTVASFQEQAREAIASLDSIGEKPIGPYELFIQDTVFLADENYISVRLLTYQFTGGAHGMTNFYALNYDMRTKRFLTAKEIVDFNKASQINALLKANLKNPEGCFDQAPTLENVNAVNMTLHTLEFTYEQYVLGPYSCGYTTISVPRKDLDGMLLIK